MANAKDFRRIALSLAGTAAAPHFERTAFRVRRIYATLAPDGKTATLMYSPDEQALKCAVAPEAFAALPNAWGARGATAVELSALTVAELQNALEPLGDMRRPSGKPQSLPVKWIDALAS
jgi:hypothetical protein